jgi:probable HAF family extracellular repeat protein
MPWPLSQDYNELIQNPQTSFADPELRGGRAVVNSLGIPIPRSGNFADVYEFYGASGSRWAIKCFTRQIPGLRERYREISQFLQQVRLPFMVDFTFLDRGIRIRSDWFPVIKMQWIDGLMLNQFVEQNLEQPQLLQYLCQLWIKLAQRLREVNLAHCDLQHGNVLLVPAGPANGQVLKLVDYDGMCVPALASRKSIEVGHPAYQHPQRLREGIYNLEVDRFSHLVIYTALRSLIAAGRQLWKRYDTGDNLLFRPEDFQAPNDSALFRELLQSPDLEMRRLANALARAAQQPLDRAPLLTDLVLDERPLHAAPQAMPVHQWATPPSPTAMAPTIQGHPIPVATAEEARVITDSPSLDYHKASTPRWPMLAALGSGLGLLGLIVGIALIATGTGSQQTKKIDLFAHQDGLTPINGGDSGIPPFPAKPGQVKEFPHEEIKRTPDSIVYRLTDLGSYAKDYDVSYATAINAAGHVVVGTNRTNGDASSLLYDGNSVTDIGTLGGWKTTGYAINDSGQVVGLSYLPGGEQYRAFLYDGKTMKNLGTLGGNASVALAINKNGLVVGWSRDARGTAHAFLHDGRTMKDLGTLGGRTSEARGINDAGLVVGGAMLPGNHTHAFLYDGIKMNDLGVLSTDRSTLSDAWAVNKSGQIVGDSATNEGRRNAFLYRDGTMRDIGSGRGLGSTAHAINLVGQVVGEFFTESGNHAFVYSKDRMVDLNTLIPQKSGWVLRVAYAINDRGQIVGKGSFQGKYRAFLLTPTVPQKVLLEEPTLPSDTRPNTSPRPELDPVVTLENIKKVQAGLTLDQVEQILGKGRIATQEDAREAKKQLEENRKKMEEARKRATGTSSIPDIALPDVDFKPGTTKYCWGTKKTWLFVDVDDRTQRVVRTAFQSSQ